MVDPIFNNAHLAELERLAEVAKEDPVLGPQSMSRLKRAQAQAQAEAAQAEQQGSLLPRTQAFRAAFFLDGEAVAGPLGIDSMLAGQALTYYTKMFAEEARVRERVAAEAAGRARRPRGSGEPKLMLTATPRGSFGFEVTPRTNDDALVEMHGDVIQSVINTIVSVGSDSDEPVDGVDNERLLPHLKQFFRTLAKHHVSIRFATTTGYRHRLEADRVTAAAERLSREVIERNIEETGVFRGLTLETGRFDFRTDKNELISGEVSGDLGTDELDRIYALKDQRCIAALQQTTIIHVEKTTTKYLLLDVIKAPPEEAVAALPV